MLEQHHMRQFLVYIFILLIPCFILWTVAAGPLGLPAIGLANLLLTNWFPDVVNQVYMQGSDALLMTNFGELNGKPIPLDEAEFQMGFKVNTQVLSYSIPFYTALHFATQKEEYFGSYVWGIIVLYTMFVLGLVSLLLRDLMVNLGGLYFQQEGVFVPPVGATIVLYQLSLLIIPTLAPAALWIWQSQDSPLLQDVLQSSGITAED